jgi:hypothetical protein
MDGIIFPYLFIRIGIALHAFMYRHRARLHTGQDTASVAPDSLVQDQLV